MQAIAAAAALVIAFAPFPALWSGFRQVIAALAGMAAMLAVVLGTTTALAPPAGGCRRVVPIWEPIAIYSAFGAGALLFVLTWRGLRGRAPA